MRKKPLATYIYIYSRTGSVLLEPNRPKPTQARYLRPSARQLFFQPNSFFLITAPPDYCLHPPYLHQSFLFLFSMHFNLSCISFIFLCTLLSSCLLDQVAYLSFIYLTCRMQNQGQCKKRSCIFSLGLFSCMFTYLFPLCHLSFCNKDLECILGFNLKLSCIFILSQTIACILDFFVIVCRCMCVCVCVCLLSRFQLRSMVFVVIQRRHKVPTLLFLLLRQFHFSLIIQKQKKNKNIHITKITKKHFHSKP